MQSLRYKAQPGDNSQGVLNTQLRPVQSGAVMVEAALAILMLMIANYVLVLLLIDAYNYACAQYAVTRGVRLATTSKHPSVPYSLPLTQTPGSANPADPASTAPPFSQVAFFDHVANVEAFIISEGQRWGLTFDPDLIFVCPYDEIIPNDPDRPYLKKICNVEGVGDEQEFFSVSMFVSGNRLFRANVFAMGDK